MSPENSPSTRLDETALDWATRLDGGLTPAEYGELSAWLAQNPAHEWRLAHFRQFYGLLHGTVPGLLAAGRVAATATPAREPVRAGRRPRVLLGALAAAAAIVLGAFWLAQRPETFDTPAAQRREVVLADGSRADLNARTMMQVRLRGADRRVRLTQGEAYFEVAKDPARPFFVETTGGTVRVTGTKFNVRTTPAGLLEVTVLEGSVAVRAGAGETAPAFALKPGDQVTCEGGLGTEQKLTRTAAEDVIAWREGKVVFDDTPLAVAAERFAAYHGRTLTVTPEAGGLLIGGRYTLDDFDSFIGSLEKTLPVHALRGENGAVRLVLSGKSPVAR